MRKPGLTRVWLVDGPSVIYQSEGAEHAEPLHVRQAELHEAEADDDAVEDVPACLEVEVGI